VKADGTKYALNLASGTRCLTSFTLIARHDHDSGKVTSPDPKTVASEIVRLWTTGIGEAPGNDDHPSQFRIETPAGFTLRGADDCSPLSFDTGSSGAKWYSGVDNSNVEPQRPAFAVSPCDEDDAKAGIKKPDTVVDPEVGILGDDDTTPGTVETPSFLDNANKARAYLTAAIAKATDQSSFRTGE
jgi:hypothetical protein